MARKGWDNLSENYRNRLQRKGITASSYNAGAPLHSARGKVSFERESFQRRSSSFAWRLADSVPSVDAEAVRDSIRSLGPREGNAYMRQRKEMIRAYERGDTARAREWWENRDPSLPDGMFYYHGIFAF